MILQFGRCFEIRAYVTMKEKGIYRWDIVFRKLRWMKMKSVKKLGVWIKTQSIYRKRNCDQIRTAHALHGTYPIYLKVSTALPAGTLAAGTWAPGIWAAGILPAWIPKMNEARKTIMSDTSVPGLTFSTPTHFNATKTVFWIRVATGPNNSRMFGWYTRERTASEPL